MELDNHTTEKKTSKHDRLVQMVLLHSVEECDVRIAFQEWEVTDCRTDVSNCVCGHVGIKTLYTIKNTLNGSVIDPIGSSCIKKFGKKSMWESVKMFALANKKYRKKGKNETFDGRTYSYIVKTAPWYVKFLVDTGVGGRRNNSSLVKFFHFISYYS